MFSCEAERSLLCDFNSTPALARSELKKLVALWVHEGGEPFTHQFWPLLGGSQTSPHAVEKRGCLPGRTLKIRCKQPSGMHGREQILSPLMFLKLSSDLGSNLVIIQQYLVLLFSSRDTNYWMLKFSSFKKKPRCELCLRLVCPFKTELMNLSSYVQPLTAHTVPEVQEIQSGTSVLSENGSEPTVGSAILGDSKTSTWNKKRDNPGEVWLNLL